MKKIDIKSLKRKESGKQLEFNTGTTKEKIINKLKQFEKRYEKLPYWRSEVTWIGVLSALFLGIYSIYNIQNNFESLPSRVAIFFIEDASDEILKDKYFLYSLPAANVIFGLLISFLASKTDNAYPRLSKLLNLLIFIFSILQVLLIQKIINIYT